MSATRPQLIPLATCKRVSLPLELVELIGADPVALARLRELVSETQHGPVSLSAPAFTVATLAVELGRSERSIRAAIARGELQAVKRGRGWVISADAVAEWARGVSTETSSKVTRRPAPARRVSGDIGRRGPGPMARGIASRQLP